MNTINLIYFSVRILPIFLNNLGSICFFCQNIGTLKGAEGIFFYISEQKNGRIFSKEAAEHKL